MKKVFLSLAALAFVATGAVSCSSDDGGTTGGNDDVVNDDTPGGDDTPGTGANGVLVYNGQDIDLDNMYFLLHAESQGGQPVAVNIGTEEAPEYATYWVGVVYDTDDVQTAPNYYQFSFFLPITDDMMIQFPNEVATEDIVLDGVYAEVNLQQVDLSAVNAGSIVFDTFVYGEGIDNPSSVNESAFGTQEAAIIGHAFDGNIEGVGTNSLLSGNSVSSAGATTNTSFRGSVNLGDLKDVESFRGKKAVVLQ